MVAALQVIMTQLNIFCGSWMMLSIKNMILPRNTIAAAGLLDCSEPASPT
jgi:hypothetical protein